MFQLLHRETNSLIDIPEQLFIRPATTISNAFTRYHCQCSYQIETSQLSSKVNKLSDFYMRIILVVRVKVIVDSEHI